MSTIGQVVFLFIAKNVTEIIIRISYVFVGVIKFEREIGGT